MIIVSHREIDKGYLESMVQPHLPRRIQTGKGRSNQMMHP